MPKPSLKARIEELLNKESAENASNTPDWILAKYLFNCLQSYEIAVNERDSWYGIEPTPGDPFKRLPSA
jgi:hypothetical protein